MKKLHVKHHLVMGAVLLIDENKNTIAKIALPESKTFNENWRIEKAKEIGQELCDAFNKINSLTNKKETEICDFCNDVCEESKVILCVSCQNEYNL